MKGHKKAFALILALFLWAGVLHSILAVDIDKHYRLTEVKKRISTCEPRVEYLFELDPDYYLLKITHTAQADKGKDVVLNGRTILPFNTRARRIKTEETSYYRISPSQIQRSNSLEIGLVSGLSQEVKIVIRNYRHSFAGDNIVVFFRSEGAPAFQFGPLRSVAAFGSACVLLGAAISLLERRHRKTAVHIIFILNILLSLIAANNCLPVSPYTLLFDSSYVVFVLVLVGSIIAVIRAWPFAARFTVTNVVPWITHKKAQSVLRKALQYTAPQKTARVLVFALAALATPLLLVHAMWTHPGCYPVEIFDESTHTFIEVPLVQEALRDGHILKMNFFNNFGTPLLGDAVANPFALHAWTYFFFKPHIAMVINKIILWILTFLALFLFYRRRSLSFYSSILTALLTVSGPAFYWFFQHHPHQGVLLYFSCILLLIDLTYSKPKVINYLLLHVSFIVFLLSSGIMGVFLGLPFAFAYTLMLGKFDLRTTARLFVLPLASGLILVHPHILYFLKISGLTWRSGFSLADAIPHYSFIDLLKGCAFLTDKHLFHTDWSINYSLVVLTFALLGFLTYRKALNKAGLVPSLILGLAPFLLITIMLRYRSIQSALPIVKSIDVTRVLWFADIFFMIPLGLMFDSLAQKRLSFVSARRLLYVAAPLLLAACYVVKSGHNPVELGAYVLSPVFLLLAYCLLVKYRPAQESAWRAFSILLFVSVLFPRYDAYETISTFQSHSEETMSYAPVEFAERMEPYYRLATHELPQHLDPSSSSDQKAAKYKILGSDGRSVIVHGKFRTFLQENDLISSGEGWMAQLYYFKPNSPEELALFGIRYFVSESKDSSAMEKLGWRPVLIAEQMGRYYRETSTARADRNQAESEALALFENPFEPSPFYYMHEDQPRFIHNYRFSCDKVEIDVPSTGDDNLEVVATFIAWPGWKAELDGKPVDILHKEDQFIRVDCADGGRLVLEFSPYSDLYIFTSSMLSVVFILVCSFLMGSKRNAPGTTGPVQIENAVDYLPRARLSRRTAGSGWWNQRFYELPLLVRQIAWISCSFHILLYRLKTNKITTSHTRSKIRNLCSARPLLSVLIFSGLAGFCLGVVNSTWQASVETGQVLAGIVRYPADNPYYIYHLKAFSLVNQISALLLWFCRCERGLSILTSGLLGMVSFWAVGATILAISRSVAISVIGVIFIYFSNHLGDGAMYPIALLGYDHTYGILGLSLVVLTMALVGNGAYRSALFCMGLAPCIHLPWAIWLIFIVLLACLFDLDFAREISRKHYPYLMAGLFISALSLGFQFCFMQDLPPLAPQIKKQYLDAFVKYWCSHRRKLFSELFRNEIHSTWLAVTCCSLSVVLCYICPRLLARNGPLRLMLRMILISGVGALAVGIITEIPPARVPAWLSVLMVGRYINLNNLVLAAMIIGVFASNRMRAYATNYNLFALFLIAALFNRHVEVRVLALIVPLIWFAYVSYSDVSPPQRTLRMSQRTHRISYKVLFSLGLLLFLAVFVPHDKYREEFLSYGTASRNLFTDDKNREFYEEVSARDGLLIIPQGFRLIPAKTRRPILIDAENANFILYALESAPQVNDILRGVYGVDLFKPPHDRNVQVPGRFYKELWERRTIEEWREIREKFGATDVLAKADWKLSLPVAVGNETMTLYEISGKQE